MKKNSKSPAREEVKNKKANGPVKGRVAKGARSGDKPTAAKGARSGDKPTTAKATKGKSPGISTGIPNRTSKSQRSDSYSKARGAEAKSRGADSKTRGADSKTRGAESKTRGIRSESTERITQVRSARPAKSSETRAPNASEARTPRFADTRPAKSSETRAPRISEERGPRRESASRPSTQFLVWGKRPVGSLLQKFISNGETNEGGKKTMFLLADKAGKVPGQLKDLVAQAQSVGLTIKVCKGHEDEAWPLSEDDGLQHQRIALSVPKYPTVHIHEVCQKLKNLGASTKGCVGVVLDQVQDPRNFGAILRSAAFFGATFAIFGEDRQAPLTSTVLKASAGGAFALDLCSVVNINRALEILKENGIWVVGSALTDGSIAVDKVPLDRPYVIVMGNEGKGMRAEITRKCDFVVKIPGGNFAVDSLNVSVAAGVLLSALKVETAPVEDETEIGGVED